MKRKEENESLLSQFEIGLYEAAVRANRNNVPALRALGYLYTKTAQYEKGLEIDKRLVSLLPEDAVCHYNLACSYSMTNQIDDAFKSLELAILLGYNDLEHLQKDPDFVNIRKDPRYQKVMEQIKGNQRLA
ncbi:MAG: hypothetical protein HY762_02265 [Planctomycetes bacterium]|nr:hypothetical protein [Planctomycetota bacterium]